MDQTTAIVLFALIAGLMSAAWLLVFPHFYRNPESIKPDLQATFFASQILRLVIGILLHPGRGAGLVCSPASRRRDLYLDCGLLRLDQPRHPGGAISSLFPPGRQTDRPI
jgi:hypothetical protein